MKKKIFLMLTVMALLVCIFAISVSAATPNNDGEVFVAADGTTLALYDTEGKALAWFYDSTKREYVSYRVGTDFTFSLSSGRELLPSSAISDTDGDANTTFPYTVSNMILLNGRDYSAFTYISGTWQNLPIQAIYVSNTFRYINKTSFNNNNTLKVFDIPKDHTGSLHIGCAFVKANALESFYIPKEAYFESTSTFEYSTGLKSVEFHDEWTGTPQGFEFNGCSALENVKLPSTLKTISKSMFRNCTSLASIKIPSGVTTIDGEALRADRAAFGGCTALKTITIPASVTFIGGYTFSGSGLETITFEPRTLVYDKDGNLTNGLDMSQYAAFENCKSLKELILPEGLTKIGNCFAKSCSALTKLSLPSTLSALDGSQHFYDTALTEVIGLENTQLTYLSDSMFRGIKTWKPEVLRLPNTCTTLYSYALADIGVQTLYLGASFVGVEGNHPLTGCSSLTTVYAPATATGLSFGNSAVKTVYLTTTDETAISAISTSTGFTTTVTLADYEANPSNYTGKVIITGYNVCKAFYNEIHNYGEVKDCTSDATCERCLFELVSEFNTHNMVESVTYPNGIFAAGTYKCVCTNASYCTQGTEELEYNAGSESAPIIVAVGYSIPTAAVDYFGINAGYQI
ncbi:MAG: leucine-rich repeat protein, partial [Clostridia bacterium]|nr:leucine-rich repeat protein [Clostridia bacterium]